MLKAENFQDCPTIQFSSVNSQDSGELTMVGEGTDEDAAVLRLAFAQEWIASPIPKISEEVRLFYPPQDKGNLLIDTFVVGDREYCLEPELRFLWMLNPETNLYEVHGKGAYDGIFTHGENLTEAKELITKELLPLFWEKYVQDKSANSARDRSL